MSIDIVFETHSLSEDNERGIATGWLDGRLSGAGRRFAAELGARRRADGITAVFSSDLGRARETVETAFSGPAFPVLLDWRLRECDYGSLNGAPARDVHGDRLAHLAVPYPGGESWQQATDRVSRFLDDLHLRWDGARLLVVGHVATRIGLDCRIAGSSLSDALQADFAWQEGWEYRLAD
jgi:2,3-bisphosphoglycerate-dependent phosphoglycerate mutase